MESVHSIIYESTSKRVFLSKSNLPSRMNTSKEKAIEKLVISTVRPKVKCSQTKPENEQINTAVMKVLQGYDWTLVPAAVK